MPHSRGIEVFLSLQPGCQRLSEFPHPDPSCAKPHAVPDHESLLPTNVSADGIPSAVSHTMETEPSIVPVYVPSVSGCQFAINYAIHQAPEPPAKYIFLKATINGRYVTSWGVKSNNQVPGITSRAFYQPGRCHRNENGIESRSFHFISNPHLQSVAEDGGVIEIKAFRARSRSRRAPKLPDFRSQHQYGVVSPSAGILENPHEARFFDWDLLDPKDSPFVSFLFHYRPWDTIQHLNLASDQESEITYSETQASMLKET